jgi:hypothetical protein
MGIVIYAPYRGKGYAVLAFPWTNCMTWPNDMRT